MYTLSMPSGTLRLDGQVVPQDDSREDYRAYAAWLAQGNGPEVVADAAEALPRIDVSAWQIRKALTRAGLRDAVETAVAGSNDIELKDGWYHSPRFYSDNALTLQMGAGLGKSAAEMHALFRLAESL